MSETVKLLCSSFLVISVCFFGPGDLCAGTEFASLSLVGTVIDKEAGNAAIVMDETEQKQYLLHEGDIIYNAVVQKVERGQIFLLKDGKEQVVGLKNRKGKGDVEAGSEDTPPRMPLSDMLPPPPPPAPAPAPLTL